MGVTTMDDLMKYLDNAHPCRVTYLGQVYGTVETAFQASRFTNPTMRHKFTIMSPYEAWYKGNKYHTTVTDWDVKKYMVMAELLEQKFSEPYFRNKLKETGTAPIVSVNNRHDTLWGVCRCKKCGMQGSNIVGKMLERLRARMKE